MIHLIWSIFMTIPMSCMYMVLATVVIQRYNLTYEEHSNQVFSILGALTLITFGVFWSM
jgi:hypothetical protein